MYHGASPMFLTLLSQWNVVALSMFSHGRLIPSLPDMAVMRRGC